LTGSYEKVLLICIQAIFAVRNRQSREAVNVN
jgi:hypothetical protein